MLRYLRIAACGFFLLLAVAIVGLWIRSYYQFDTAYASGSDALRVGSVHLHSCRGVVDCDVLLGIPEGAFRSPSWPYPYWNVTAADSARAIRWLKGTGNRFRFSLGRFGLIVVLPHWFLAACSFAVAALLYFKKSWRFTTRSLLIATTVTAAVLGLFVYLIRRQ